MAGNFGMARGPVGMDAETHTGWAGAHAFSVAKDSENKEAAVQLVKFLTSEAVEFEESNSSASCPSVPTSRRCVAAERGHAASPLDAERWELANLQVSEDFRTPPLFADWISFTNEWYPTLQSHHPRRHDRRGRTGQGRRRHR